MSCQLSEFEYKNKYLKYKFKYLDLIKQKGGAICNLEEWVEITNNGQQNCGIFIHKTNPSIIMKCGASMSKNIEKINSQASIFPKEISECNDSKNRTYLIMERLDGDITSIYFNILPMIVLDKMQLDKNTIRDIKMIFDIKTNTTMKPIIPKDQQENILGTISSTNKNITLKLYDTFIDKLKEEWIVYHNIISKEIVKVLLKLLELGFSYNDMKFDNFGYKLSDTIIGTDYRKGDVPKIYDKYFYVYILDPVSGLSILFNQEYDNFERYLEYNTNYESGFSFQEIETTLNNFKKQQNLNELKTIYENYILESNKNLKCNTYLSYFNDGFDLSAHGQYYLSNMNRIIRGEWNYIIKKYDDLPSHYSDEIKSILTKEYKCIFNKYDFKTIEELLNYFNKIKCKSCDKLLNLDYKYCYNCGIKNL